MAIKLEGGDDEDLDLAGNGQTSYNPPNLPDFGVGGSIFGVPGGLLSGATTIGADGATPGGFNSTGFLPGSDVGFDVPGVGSNIGNVFTFGAPGSMAPGGMSLTDLLNPWNQRTDISQLNPNWGTWDPSGEVTTAADLSGFTVSQRPWSNLGIDQTALTGKTPIGPNVTTPAAGDVTLMDPYKVNENTQAPLVLNPNQYINPSVMGGNALLGGVTTTATSGVTVMDPFQVVGTRPQTATLNITPSSETGPSSVGGTPSGGDGVTQLPAVTVTGDRVTTPSMSSQDMINLLNQATTAWGTAPIQVPPLVVSGTTPTSVRPPTVTTPTITPPTTGVVVPPAVTVPPSTKTTPPPTGITPTTTSTPPAITQTGTATPPSTGTTSSAMNERDLAKELEKTMAAFDRFRPGIQQMYGDLYQQFMPKGITAAEPGLISQYQSDLARLQQRQAGILAPEDIRQSQQAAREAYGARGQVMGPGAVGAEILNREAIRQQREDQARAALQQSYGNILNTANIQTGNLFSPIASLMSSTFNPLGAYPADVYGTNVNAQLARDIAQKNYEAAVKSAELSGAAQKQAGTTSAIGNIGSALIPSLISGIGSIFCWVAREVYGENNPKWLQFREWMFTCAPCWFFNFYLEHGERIAAWLKRHAWAKAPIRIWMDSRIRSLEKRQLVLKEAV